MMRVIEVVVLGSGTPIPTPDRAGSGLAVVDDTAWVLVDCGRAITQRALQAGLDLTSLVAVLVTHHHSDHISDLATLAIPRWTAGASTPLTAVGPDGPVTRYAALSGHLRRAVLPRPGTRCGRPATVDRRAAVRGLDAAVVALERDGWLITTALVDHHPVAPAVGYRIERAGRVVTVSGDTAVC